MFGRTQRVLFILIEKKKITGNITFIVNLLMLNTTCPVLANSVVPDQLASEEAN